MISAMESRWPRKLILNEKIDLDTAYLPIHANVTTALTFISIVDEIAFL